MEGWVDTLAVAEVATMRFLCARAILKPRKCMSQVRLRIYGVNSVL
jgi:hypothetical protein